MKRFLKTLFTSFTFYFVILSLLIIWNHYTGGDSKSIVLIHFNFILHSICYTDIGQNVISKGPLVPSKTILGEFSVYWYIAHLISFVAYGAVLDGMKVLIKLLLRKAKPERQTKAVEGNSP